RTTLLPCSPHFSLTVAPADCRARLVMWQRMSCSVNSLEPTVKVAPFSEAILARLPPLTGLVLVELKHPAVAVTVMTATVKGVSKVRSERITPLLVGWGSTDLGAAGSVRRYRGASRWLARAQRSGRCRSTGWGSG